MSILLEIFLFNYKHWESYFFQKPANPEYLLGSGLEWMGDTVFRITDSQNAYFEVTNINENIKNIILDLEMESSSSVRGEAIPIQIDMTDEANTLYRSLPMTEVVKGIAESAYIRLHLIGESSSLRVWIHRNNDELINMHRVELNGTRPLIFHIERILFFIIVGSLYLVFRPKSSVYTDRLDYKKSKHKKVIYALIVFHMLVIGGISISALPFAYWEGDPWEAHAQYEDLTDALLDGHVYLNQEPPEVLKTMENPYDCALRAKVESEAGVSSLFDFAYYNGRYYCYFGIVPALLFFVPFKLVTGYHLQTWIAVAICGILFCISSFSFVYQLAKRYFKNVSLGLYLLMSSVYIAASSIVYLVHFGNVYSLPIMLGLLLGITGLTFWLAASNNHKIRKAYLTAGAVSIALVMGCRPQLAIIMVFAFPIFWNEIKEKLFFSKQGLGNTLCIVLPFLVIGVGLMYYNFIRFGSPFDFGANYNLTSNDMTHKGFVFSRNFMGLFQYFIQPLNIKSVFPFLNTIEMQSEYQGYLSTEPLFGGYLAINMIAFFSFGIFKYKSCLKEKCVWGLSLSALIAALLIVEADIQMSGLTQRYMSDFGWIFIIPAILIIFMLHDKYIEDKIIFMKYLKFITFLSAICIILNYFNLFIQGRYASIINTNPYLFYLVKYMFFKC